MGLIFYISIKLLMISSMFFGDYLPIISYNYGSVILSFILIIVLFIVFYIMRVIGRALLFRKAGEKSYKAFIPFYSSFVHCKIVGVNRIWFLIYIFIFLLMLSFGAFPDLASRLFENYEYYYEYYNINVYMSNLRFIFWISYLIYGSIVSYKTSKAFGKSSIYSFGLLFCPPIFYFLLGRDSSKYQFEESNNLKKVNLVVLWSNVIKCILVIFIFVIVLLFIWLYPTRVDYKNSSSNNTKVDRDFRNYLESNYGVDLDEDPTPYFGYTEGKKLGGYPSNQGYYSAQYRLKDDESFWISIKRRNNKYTVDIDKNTYKIRKELYDYIKSVKKDSYVPNYLIFYHNDKNDFDYNGTYNYLSYAVYDKDNNKFSEEELLTDYKILQKAKSLFKKYNVKRHIKVMAVRYINDPRIQTEGNWNNKFKFETNYSDQDYVLDTYSCGGEYNDEKYTNCMYTLEESQSSINSLNLDDLSFDEFKERVERVINKSN